MDPTSTRGTRIGAMTLLAALALTLCASSAAAQDDESSPAGALTVHASAAGPALAVREFEGCELYVRGHGVASATGNVTFYYAPNGTYEPTQVVLPFEGTANGNGTYDFTVGPFAVPAAGEARANLLVATMDSDGSAAWLQNLSLGCDRAEVPFFTSPLAFGLGALGVALAGMVLRRK